MSVSLKTVVLVQTRKPASLAALMPSIAASKTPSRSTAMSWFFRIPSRWTLKKNGAAGRELGDLLADEHAVGAEDRRPSSAPGSWRRVRRSRDRSSARRRRSRPPGAPHSSTASRHSWIESFCLIVDSYSRIRPQPVQVRLQACSGSSIRTIGNFSVRGSFSCERRSRRCESSSAGEIAWASTS